MSKDADLFFFGVPTLYEQMLEFLEQQDAERGTRPDPNGTHELASVRLCISAGEALPPDLFQRWKARFGVEILVRQWVEQEPRIPGKHVCIFGGESLHCPAFSLDP